MPVEIKHKQNKLVGRVIKLVVKKNLKSIFITPANIQSMSSGKKGNSIIKKNIYLPCSSFDCSFKVLSFPIAQYKSLMPKVLPKKKAKILPKIIESVLSKKAINGPNKITPTIVVAKAGRGKIVTCKNCNTTNTE